MVVITEPSAFTHKNLFIVTVTQYSFRPHVNIDMVAVHVLRQ